MSKLIEFTGPSIALESRIACRNEPGPESFVFVTTNVAACPVSRNAQTRRSPERRLFMRPAYQIGGRCKFIADAAAAFPAQLASLAPLTSGGRRGKNLFLRRQVDPWPPARGKPCRRVFRHCRHQVRRCRSLRGRSRI